MSFDIYKAAEKAMADSERGVWVAGYNMPGYLPEMEPAAFTDFEDAKHYMLEEMDRTGDSWFSVADSLRETQPEEAQTYLDEADELSEAMEDLNLISNLRSATGAHSFSDWGVVVGNVSYWITYNAEATLADYEDGQ